MRLDIKKIPDETAKKFLKLSKEKGISRSETGSFIIEQYFNLLEEKERKYKNRSKGKKGITYKKSIEKREKNLKRIEEIILSNPYITMKDISNKIGLSYQNIIKNYSDNIKNMKKKYDSERLYNKEGIYNG